MIRSGDIMGGAAISASVRNKYTLRHTTSTHCNSLQHTATHCSTLQHTATHCSTLHHTGTMIRTGGMMVGAANQRHYIQHIYTALHYITLQHIATHRNND